MASDITLQIDDGIINVRVGAIIMKDGKVLMATNQFSDYYYSIGGRIQFGESSQEAVIREVFEETGIHLQIKRLAFIHENFFVADNGKNKGKRYYEISYYYLMDTPEDFNPVYMDHQEGEYHESLKWIDLDTSETIYPQFFHTELFQMSDSIKHIITDQTKVKRSTK